jgi:hypothetical protein
MELIFIRQIMLIPLRTRRYLMTSEATANRGRDLHNGSREHGARSFGFLASRLSVGRNESDGPKDGQKIEGHRMTNGIIK